MNTKKIALGVIATTLLAGTAATYAAENYEPLENKLDMIEERVESKFGHKDHDSERGYKGKKMMKMFTDEEKTALESMSSEEKQAFIEAKHTEIKAQREAREAVIDALLAGESLSAEQETLRAEIIAERAEKKAERAQMQALRDKVDAGDTLTEEEEEILEAHKEKRGHKGGRR